MFITGRIKDIIIKAGRNIYPQELEELVGGLEGVRKGCVAAFPSTLGAQARSGSCCWSRRASQRRATSKR